jgi:predicted phage tail protein
MGAAIPFDLAGRKGGESNAKTPVESPDSLQSVAKAKILIAVGEGEFDQTPTAQNIYLDNTPLANADGGLNFEGVTWDWRPGSIDQTYIPGIPSVENETTVNVELTSSNAWVRSVSNTQLSAVRVRFAWPALQRQEDDGDVVGYAIQYAVDVATDGGSYVEVLNESVNGKTTTRYERSRRIDLPEATTGWQIRVRRLTANQNSNRIADTMIIAGFTEVIDAKLRYPNTALLYIEFSAEQFSNIPAVTVECRARRVQVPSNYDPTTRAYTGVWDGTMVQAWTDNPVWLTYDIAVNDRFGVGRRIKSWMVDRWEMYRIAQYCDQLVPDGKGGQEPRHICNINLQSRVGAWELMRDISAIYRGMTYWAQGQLKVQADIPRATDFDFAYTRANVIDGKFSYGSASERTRYSRALVSYDNPSNNYDTDVAVSTDKRLQLRYGDNPVEISAIGCTRESEAQRRGKWALLTNSQDRTVTFKVGMDGAIPLPGYIIPIADSLLAGREVGGRISAVAGNTITLDRDTMAKAGDRLILNLPSGKCEGRTVQSVSGRSVTVTTAYSETPERELIWALDADELAVPLYRVMKVSRPEKGVFEITALQYEPSKFAAIDTGAKLETRPISVLPTGVIDPPASIALSTFSAVSQGIAVTTMTITWPAVSNAVAYEVEWKKDDGNWIRLPRTGTLGVDVTGIYAGQYLARVRAISAMEIASIWRTSDQTTLEGKTTPPPALAYLTATPEIFGITVRWGFPAEGAADTAYTDIQYGSTQSEEAALSLGQFSYPTGTHTLTGLAAGVSFWFRGRLVDRSGNIGPWSDWVQGQSSADASAILDYITGQITETQLGSGLLAEIEKISGDGTGSVNERIDTAADALGVQITSLAAQVADIVGASDWDSGTAYLEGSLVKFDGSLFRAVQDVPAGTPTTDTAYWENVGDYSSLGELVTALAVRVDDVETAVGEVEGEMTALSTRVDGVYAQVYPAMAGATDWQAGTTVIQAGVWSVYTAFADGDEALAQRIDVIEAEIGDGIQAAIQEEATARADADGALAEQITTLTATVGDNSAAIEVAADAVASLDGELSTMYSIKLGIDSNGKYYAAGMGIGIENTPSGMQSQVLFVADRFAILNSINGTPVSPFVVQGGQTIINNAVIGDASINFAKITDTLQSDNYVPNVSGWRLTKAGGIEINGTVAGGGRLTLNNELLQVYYSSSEGGGLAVRLGIWS